MAELEDKQNHDEIKSTESDASTDSKSDLDQAPNDELAEALREKDQFKRLAQRAQADLVNYRRRIDAEQASSRLRNQQRIVLRFADVIDQLDVALKSDVASQSDPGWLEGVGAIQKNFVSVMSAEGFERFNSVGEQFDPRKHEALLSTPSSDHEPNTVITELRPGYSQDSEVVRPAQVEIAISPPVDPGGSQ
ncbi:MAG: nucleotide exchange factor GrpE [Chloroflexi bacterium]|nr:nucleotide exchange factor GrpE [Chloroflexota bacterium]